MILIVVFYLIWISTRTQHNSLDRISLSFAGAEGWGQVPPSKLFGKHVCCFYIWQQRLLALSLSYPVVHTSTLAEVRITMIIIVSQILNFYNGIGQPIWTVDHFWPISVALTSRRRLAHFCRGATCRTIDGVEAPAVVTARATENATASTDRFCIVLRFEVSCCCGIGQNLSRWDGKHVSYHCNWIKLRGARSNPPVHDNWSYTVYGYPKTHRANFAGYPKINPTKSAGYPRVFDERK